MTNSRSQTEISSEVKMSYVLVVCFVAAVGGFLFGYDLVIISGAQLPLFKYFNLQEREFAQGLVTASASIGCIVGPFLGMFLCDALGRRRTLVLAALLFGVSAIGTALPDYVERVLPVETFWTFILMRAIGGLGIGLASVASPMYIIEVAPPKWRGALGLMFQLAVCIGAVAAVIVAWLVARSISDVTNWRWMFGSEMVSIIAFVVLLKFVPYSPRWLAEKGRDDEALAVMKRISGPQQAEQEMAEIRESLEAESGGGFAELWQPGMRMALLVGVLLAFFNNWTGWTAVGIYLPMLFKEAGTTITSEAIQMTIPVFALDVILTIVAMWLVDRVGRRIIWNTTAFAMIFATFFAGLVYQFDIRGLLVMLVLFGIAIPHAIGLGGLPWLMMSELYPTRIRAKAVAVTTSVVWIGGYTVMQFFPVIIRISKESALGTLAGAFWVFSVISVFALIFGLTLLPETKNKTLEEITRHWHRS